MIKSLQQKNFRIYVTNPAEACHLWGNELKTFYDTDHQQIVQYVSMLCNRQGLQCIERLLEDPDTTKLLDHQHYVWRHGADDKRLMHSTVWNKGKRVTTHKPGDEKSQNRSKSSDSVNQAAKIIIVTSHIMYEYGFKIYQSCGFTSHNTVMYRILIHSFIIE